MLQTLLWRRMTCSSTFLKYPLAVLVQTPATYILMLYVVSNSGKRYWDCKLPCIEAQIELSSTFVYDQKMSTSGGSRLSRGGRMAMMPMSVNRSAETFIAEQNILIRKKIPIHWRKEWQKFQSCKFINGQYQQYFCENFILHCDVIRFTGMVIIVVCPPWVRCEFLAELPLVLILEATNSSKSRWKCIAIHQNVCSRSLSQNCQGIF